MNAPSRHARALGAHMLGSAITLLLTPGLLLALLGTPATSEPWLTVAAGIALALGDCCVAAGHAGARWFFGASLLGRCPCVPVAFYAA